MTLDLKTIAENPNAYSYPIDADGTKLTLRPLEPKDEKAIVDLINSLSEQTKHFYSYTKEPAEKIAKDICDAINKYDKLRFVLERNDNKELIGLFELSMDIPQENIEKFKRYGIELEENDCRFGPLLKDSYQSKGISSKVFPLIVSIAKEFGKKRMILWGGVNKDNPSAIGFYEKNGFKNLGEFTDEDNYSCCDMILQL